MNVIKPQIPFAAALSTPLQSIYLLIVRRIHHKNGSYIFIARSFLSFTCVRKCTYRVFSGSDMGTARGICVAFKYM